MSMWLVWILCVSTFIETVWFVSLHKSAHSWCCLLYSLLNNIDFNICSVAIAIKTDLNDVSIYKIVNYDNENNQLKFKINVDLISSKMIWTVKNFQKNISLPFFTDIPFLKRKLATNLFIWQTSRSTKKMWVTDQKVNRLKTSLINGRALLPRYLKSVNNNTIT